MSRGARDDEDRTVTLDSVVARGMAPPPGFVDVDDAELDVLAGMQELLRVHRPVVFVEVHGADREGDCTAFLTSRGYEVRIVQERVVARPAG